MGVKKSGKTGAVVPMERITRAILLIRGHKVMLDSDLAELYGVATKVLIQAVKRNQERFPEDFTFQLSSEEFELLRRQSGTSSLRSQFVTSNPNAESTRRARGGRRYAPYVFTEQGVAMLSSVLHSARAIHVNIGIMRAFVQLRQMLASNTELARKLATLERKYDAQFKIVFDAIRELMTPPEPKKKRPIGFGPWDDK
jgi:hypothetical protein